MANNCIHTLYVAVRTFDSTIREWPSLVQKKSGWYISHIESYLQTIVEVLDYTFNKIFAAPKFTYMIQRCEHLELFHKSEFRRLSKWQDGELKELTLRLLCTC